MHNEFDSPRMIVRSGYPCRMSPWSVDCRPVAPVPHSAIVGNTPSHWRRHLPLTELPPTGPPAPRLNRDVGRTRLESRPLIVEGPPNSRLRLGSLKLSASVDRPGCFDPIRLIRSSTIAAVGPIARSIDQSAAPSRSVGQRTPEMWYMLQFGQDQGRDDL